MTALICQIGGGKRSKARATVSFNSFQCIPLFPNQRIVICLLCSPRLGPPILELVFLSAQYTIEDPKNPPTTYMIIHCGSNDLTEVKTAHLIHDISADIIRFKLLLPNTKIVWSDILMRRY
jgi:hypothetical protein